MGGGILQDRCRQGTGETVIVVQTSMDNGLDESDAGGKGKNRNILRDIQHNHTYKTWLFIG